jgi:hypothetical protein
MLSLNSIISVNVNLPASSVSTQNFSLGLIISANTAITTTDRVKVYASTDEMIADGFSSSSAEVIAAGLYFGQTPSPSQIAVGVKGSSETVAEALAACRAANSDWYACIFLDEAKADIEALAAYAESASPPMVLFYTTADAEVLAGTAGNVCLALKASAYRRSLGQYSTQANAVASIMGYACGASNNAYDLAFKNEPGVTATPLTTAQASVLSNANCNYFATYDSSYSFFMKGVMADGSHFDEVIGIDILTAEIKANIMSVLTSATEVPLTDAGTSIITTAISSACNAALTRGFLAAGTWAGGTVLDLSTGDALTTGYSIQAGSVANLSSADKTARIAPPIYTCVILAGSGESFAITLNVDR